MNSLWGPVVRSRHLLNAKHTVPLWLFPLCLLHNGEKGSWNDKWWRDDMKNYRFCWQLRNENAFKTRAQLLMDTWWLCWIEWLSRCLHLWCMASVEQENVQAWKLLFSSQVYSLKTFCKLKTCWHTQVMHCEISFLETQAKLSTVLKKNLHRSPEHNRVWRSKLRGSKQGKHLFDHMSRYIRFHSQEISLHFILNCLCSELKYWGFYSKLLSILGSESS